MHAYAASRWVAVARATDLVPESARVVRAGELELALIRTAAGVFALDNACPHTGGPLGEGLVQRNVVTCPLHGWQFDCITGACLTEKGQHQQRYAVKIDQEQVWVEVPVTTQPAVAEAWTVVAEASDAKPAEDTAGKQSRVEIWKAAKHGIDVWPDILRYAQAGTPMAAIDDTDLERMKWYGYFYRKNNDNNHYMCRVRIPGCEMTTDQARALAFAAYESGYSLIDITTRGNIQIQGLTIDKLPGVRAALEKVGLTSRQSGHDNVRNITSHPWSGIDPEELLDTRELARHIQSMIIGNREFSDLPRKFNIALTGRVEAAGHAWTQDLSYVAARGVDGDIGFQLLLGGTQGQAPHLAWYIPVFVRPEQVLGVTAAILRTFRELGYRHNRNQVRFRYLMERLGPDQVLVEIEQRLGYELERFPNLSPRPAEEENFLGWFKQKQPDLWAVGVCVPVGRLTWDQFEGLAVIARQYGNGRLRTTYDQNLLLPGMPAASRQAVGYALARHGLTFEPDPVTRHMVACTGKQFCNLAVTETKGYAYQLIETLRRRNVQLHGINIHMSGCPSACAMSHTADIGLKGVKIRRRLRVVDAFDVYLGGGIATEVHMGILYQKGVPFDQLPEFLEQVIREFYLHRGDAETFSQFWRKKLQGHKATPAEQELPTWHCTRCGHLHVAADPPPFCPICAALRAQFAPAPSGVAPAQAGMAPPSDKVVRTKARRLAAGPPVWVCTSCNQSSEAPPEFCPVCGAPAADCRRAGVADVPLFPQPARASGKRLLIVGGSIAGHTAAQTARALDPTVHITLVTDEHYSFYNRLNLTRFLAEEVRRETLFDYTPEWYDEQHITVRTETRVISLDPVKKLALLSAGEELPYDTCILTHGSTAHTPPFYRADLPGVFLLRTLDNVEHMLQHMRPGVQVAVIGGGVLGLEAAYGFVKRGAAVQVFEYMPRLMPRQLDAAGAALLTAMVQEKGIVSYVGVGVQELLGSARVTGLQLADGRCFDADVVVVSTGIKPNIDWVKRSGIHCVRGVVVDDRMQTSAENVFAAGDVVEWREQVVGLWTNAIEQAKVAATNAVAQMAFFQGCVPVTILKCLDIPLVSIGDILEDGDDITSQVQYDAAGHTYRRVIFRHGIPVGAILLGTSRGMGDVRKLIQDGWQLERLRQQVVADDVMAVAS